MAGISIEIEGSGTAYDQSLSSGTVMENGSTVTVRLRDYEEKTEEVPVENEEDLDNGNAD